MELVDVVRSMQKECQVKAGSRLVVGVSGGADSLCLLDLLRRMDYNVLVVHFDHSLREESADDAERVRDIALKMGMAFVLGREDVRAYAHTAGLSIEEAARNARYKFLFQQARNFEAQAVTVAHTADDQVETVLMHLLRGAGLSGLKGMTARVIIPEWDETIPLVRPLLEFWREDTVTWCRENLLLALHDPSNQDVAFFRNRLRHELIPYLKEYNPNVKEIIWRMARVLSGDWQVLTEQTNLAWQRCWIEDGPGWVVLELAQVQDLVPGMQRAILRQVIDRLRPGLRDINFEAVERALEWLANPPPGRWLDLAAGLMVWVEWGRITITETRQLPIDETWPQILQQSEQRLTVPGEVLLANGWKIQADWETEDNSLNKQPLRYYIGGEGLGRLEMSARLDGDRLKLPLMVRGLRAGERMTPLGMGGHGLKLSDLFTNRKLPQRARANWPLVISGDVVTWAVGLRIGDSFKLEEQTLRVVRLEMLKI